MPAPSPAKTVVTARDREMRRVRIMGMVQSGFSYESIAKTEHVSREWVRRIVVKALEDGAHGPRVDPRLLQAARLEPALRLAAHAVAEGKLEGVDRLLKVLDRLDKYGAAALGAGYDEDYRALLLEKLDRTAARGQQQPIGPEPPANDHPPASNKSAA